MEKPVIVLKGQPNSPKRMHIDENDKDILENLASRMDL